MRVLLLVKVSSQGSLFVVCVLPVVAVLPVAVGLSVADQSMYRNSLELSSI
jgi:hypothetical protein